METQTAQQPVAVPTEQTEQVPAQQLAAVPKLELEASASATASPRSSKIHPSVRKRLLKQKPAKRSPTQAAPAEFDASASAPAIPQDQAALTSLALAIQQSQIAYAHQINVLASPKSPFSPSENVPLSRLAPAAKPATQLTRAAQVNRSPSQSSQTRARSNGPEALRLHERLSGAHDVGSSEADDEQSQDEAARKQRRAQPHQSAEGHVPAQLAIDPAATAALPAQQVYNSQQQPHSPVMTTLLPPTNHENAVQEFTVTHGSLLSPSNYRQAVESQTRTYHHQAPPPQQHPHYAAASSSASVHSAPAFGGWPGLSPYHQHAYGGSMSAGASAHLPGPFSMEVMMGVSIGYAIAQSFTQLSAQMAPMSAPLMYPPFMMSPTSPSEHVPLSQLGLKKQAKERKRNGKKSRKADKDHAHSAGPAMDTTTTKTSTGLL
ncbi:hypothetical protein RI367_003307 [Sorochytrium milnesiophthora]